MKRHHSTTHGLSHSRFDNTYGGIKARCNDVTSKIYGGRGIKNHWLSFDNFIKDMYPSYLKHVQDFGEKNTQIDRIDNNLGYCKENCRWVTTKEQASNKRSNINITYKNKTKTLSQWAEELNIKIGTLRTRIVVLGWPIEKSFETKVNNAKIKGVYFSNQSNKWYAQGYKNNKIKHLGIFNTPEDAKIAYIKFNN